MPSTVITDVSTTRSRLVGLAAILFPIAGLAILIAFAALNWPFTRQHMIDALQESSARTVLIDRFHMTYFPPGCVAEGIRFLHRKHRDKPPLITVQRLMVEGSYSGLIGSPKRLTKVRVIGMHVTVPPRSPDGTNPIMPLTDVKSARPVVAATVVSDGVVLDFMSHAGQQVYKLVINQLTLSGVGNNQPISYRATIASTEPPGEIHSSGRFGPWIADDPGRTALTGSYTFDHADLGVFQGISGILGSTGQFSGTLDHIGISGHTDVPDFRVGHSGHSPHIESDFRAVVNATEGDTFLQQVDSRINRTILTSKGSVAGAEGEKGKTVSLDVSTISGRVEDLLNLFLTAKQPPLTGYVSLNAKVTLPPEHRAFLEKLTLDGDFGLASGKFTGGDTQGALNKLSMSARHDATREQEENPETALSNLKGHVSANRGVATLTNVSFSIPGADAKVHGVYNLLTQQVDLHGVLTTAGKIYVTQQGFNSLLLRAITPFLKHKPHATVVPFKITGVYPNAVVALELFGQKK